MADIFFSCIILYKKSQRSLRIRFFILSHQQTQEVTMYPGPSSNQAKLKVKKTVASGEIKPTISLNLLCLLKYHGENTKNIYFI